MRFSTPILHDFNNISNVWTHMCHTILAFDSFNVRVPLKYVLRTNVIHIFWRNPHTIPINLITIYANSVLSVLAASDIVH